MEACTFFGHRDLNYQHIEDNLTVIIKDLITKNGVNTFFVGDSGNFDKTVYRVLINLKKTSYPDINISLVLAYLPKQNEFSLTDYSNSVYPEGIENVPLRFAIIFRNNFMIENSKYVITYVKRDIGGAAKFKAIAEKKDKLVIELSNI